MKKIAILLSLLAVGFCQEEPCCKSDLDPKTEEGQRITFRTTQGTGIGFNQGYSSLDVFLTHNLERDYLLFADARGHLFNSGKYALSGGLGVRKYSPNKTTIWGVNGFYDFRQIGHRHDFFQQIGFGLEALWQYWTLRGNAYVPIGPQEWKFGKHTVVDFYGVDVELGRTLCKADWFELDGMLAGYYLSHDRRNQGGGGLFRLTAKMSAYVTLEGQTSYDNLFHWTGWGTVAFNYSFGPRQCVRCIPDCAERGNYSARTIEAVSRLEIIPEKWHR